MAQTERQKIGALMHHWHSGTDAIYAVGSYYYQGMKYPNRKVVENAQELLESDLRKAEQGMHGWTKKDAAELRKILRFLEKDLASGHVRGRTQSQFTARHETPFKKGQSVEVQSVWASAPWTHGGPRKAWFKGFEFVRFRNPSTIVVRHTKGMYEGMETNHHADDVRPAR